MIIGTVWKNPLRIWNQRFLEQPSSCGETFQSCAWQKQRMIISTDLKRSASNLKPTYSAATIFVCWNVSMLCMTTKTNDDQYWFKEVFLEPETNGFCSNRSLMVKHLNFVDDNQSLRSSVLIWRGLLWIGNQRFHNNHSMFVKRLSFVHYSQTLWWSVLIWNGLLQIWSERFLQQQFSDCETSQYCPWQPKPRNIGFDLKRSA